MSIFYEDIFVVIWKTNSLLDEVGGIWELPRCLSWKYQGNIYIIVASFLQEPLVARSKNKSVYLGKSTLSRW